MTSWIGFALLGVVGTTSVEFEVDALLQPANRLKTSASLLGPQLDAARLQWIHMPKCGSGFGNTVVTWACHNLPSDLQFDYPAWRNNMFDEVHVAQYGCATGFTAPNPGNHSTVTDDLWNEHQGNLIAMFRRPDQRFLSDYRMSLNIAGHEDDTVEDFMQWHIPGCYTQVLNGFWCGNTYHPPTAQMIDTAIHRVRTGFAFVGLTDEWNLSVCLFHAMFGGPCHDREFQVINANEVHSYDAPDEWAGLLDSDDDLAVYDEVVRTFRANLITHKVTTDSCKTICAAAAWAFE